MSFWRGWLATTGLGNRPDLAESVSWECVHDPDGNFQGRAFRWLDIETSAAMKTWPDGIQFRDLRTGRIVQYESGQLKE